MKIDATQIVLIVVIAIMIIVYPILMVVRNKKENQRLQEQTNSLKKGDKILTTSGIYGTVVDLHLEEDRKVVIIETGTDKNKGYLSVDAFAVYKVFKDEEPAPPVATESAKPVEKPKQPKQESKKQEALEQETTQEPKNEDKQ